MPPPYLSDTALGSITFWDAVFGCCIILVIVVAIKLIMHTKPAAFYRFIHAVWNTRINDDKQNYRWMPQFMTFMFVLYFIGRVVHCILHYPLLCNVFGATVFEVGVIDAASSTVGAMLDVVLRHRRCPLLRKLSRAQAFLLDAMISATAYIGIVGYVLPNSSHYLAMTLVVLSQTMNNLNLDLQEIGTMRAEFVRDVVNNEDISDPMYKEIKKVGLKLTQLQVVLNYPATLIGSLLFGQSVGSAESIYDAYIIVGTLNLIAGLCMAFLWRNQTIEPPTSIESANRPRFRIRDDLRPGGRYFSVIAEVGVFNAFSMLVRNGYIRLLNLNAIEMDLAKDDVGFLVSVVFGISTAFFWLADVHQKKQTLGINDVEQVSKGMRKAGLLSFLLLGFGHCTMGVAADPSVSFLSNAYKVLVLSAIFFGFGQATSTGLRTARKDDVRDMLEELGHEENDIRTVLRFTASIATFSNIVNSLAVGVLGQLVGLKWVSYFYACVSFLGFCWTLRFSKNLKHLVEESCQNLTRHESDD